jgi:hypothetical protein
MKNSNREIHAATLPAGMQLEEFFTDLDNGICPHCKKKVTQQKVGHCVYGSCGHRLFQGTPDKRYVKI